MSIWQMFSNTEDRYLLMFSRKSVYKYCVKARFSSFYLFFCLFGLILGNATLNKPLL